MSDIANVTSPPYDVISAGILDGLLAADPHNIVRLILPGAGHGEAGGGTDEDGREHGEGEGGPGPGHGQLAASRLRGWLSSGVLVQDPVPALYVYEQSGSEDGGWRQRGLIGLVRVGSPDSAGILPHEDVMPGPVAGRRELMAATRANLEPIFLVYDGGPGAADAASPAAAGAGPAAAGPAAAGAGPAAAGAGPAAAGPAGAGGDADDPGPGVRATAAEIVDRVAAEVPPVISAVTGDGITHRLWQLTDPAEHAAIAADLAGRHAMIADGHHRYAAYRELRDEMHSAGQGAGSWDYGLAFLVDSVAYPPRLGAIHRVLPGLPPDRAAELAKTAFTVRELTDASDLDAALRGLAEAGRDGTAFLLADDTGFRLLSNPDLGQLAATMPAGTSPRWQKLDASVLQELLLARVWGIEDNEHDVLIFHDAGEAARVASALGGTAVIMNPISFTAVRDIAAHGERVPRKSTSFGPKPRTGFVFRTFED